MNLVQRLRYLAAKSDCPQHVGALLEEAATRIEDQRQWRDAWLKAEKRVDLLTGVLSMLRLERLNRKKKEQND